MIEHNAVHIISLYKSVLIKKKTPHTIIIIYNIILPQKLGTFTNILLYLPTKDCIMSLWYYMVYFFILFLMMTVILWLWYTVCVRTVYSSSTIIIQYYYCVINDSDSRINNIILLLYLVSQYVYTVSLNISITKDVSLFF